MVERIRVLLESRQLTPTQFADAIGVARPIVSHILSGRNKPSLDVVQRILGAMPDLSMVWLMNGSGPMLAGNEPTPIVAPLPNTFAQPAPATPSRPKSAPPSAKSAGEGDMPPKIKELKKPHGVALPPIKRFLLAKAALRHEQAGQHSATPATVVAVAGEALSAPIKVKNDEVEPIAAAAAPTAGGVHHYEPGKAVTGVKPAATITENVADNALDEIEALTAPSGVKHKPIRRIVIFYHDGSFADYTPE